MNVGCPSCNTVYRIDPAKVPEAGVRARCTVCSSVIPVTRDGEEPSPAPTTVAAGTRPVPEPREPSASQEEIAATLGEAFIAPPEEPGGADSETPVTEAAPAPPPVPVARSAQPASPGLATEPSGPDSQPAGPTAVPAGHPPTPVPETPSPVARRVGGLRVTRPFSQPGPGHTPSPSQQGQGQGQGQVPQRPTAPVFRPTPGRPLKPASAPPAEPRVTATAPTVAEPAMPAEPAAPSPPTTTPAVTEATPAVGKPLVAQPAPPDQTTEAAVPAIPVPSKPGINPFMSRDPKLKARRLARALISDMIVYQPEKRQEALDGGNLKEVFEGEIKKSWAEYVGQVGEEIANSTPYFTEALNEILAGGQPVF